ncbi:MAG: high-affinity branched-chain amino acid ABC transporter substrate-binding protein [Desulfobulbaceae bacterium]|jgi:branched-chain amino acid transport system substrate-binding protein|nr:high-affinity branched-chain amino acid ABC transporter substrate-binding protein [Desulfobulbaceae bacterium]
MKMQKTVMIAVLAAVMIVAGGEAKAQNTIKVAVASALTGPVAQYGDMQRAGIHLAVERVNAAGGVLGKKIELVEMDDACEPKQSPAVANEVVSQKIKFVLGHVCSGAFKPAAQIYDENDILMITSSATSDDLSTYGYKMFFRTIGKDSQQGPVAAIYIINTIKPKKLAIIHDKQTYGQGVATQVKNTVEEHGLKPVMFEGINKGDTDFSALITKMKQAGVDFVYYGGYHPELIILLKQARDQDLGARWMGPEGAAVSDVKGESVEGLLVTLPPDFSKEPDNAKIAEAFRAKKQDPSGAFVMTSYAAAQVLIEALKGAQSEDQKTVAEYMHKNKFKTVLGNVEFTPAGDWATARFDIFVWHKDASKTLAP